jgi:hypothetical protein
MHSDLVLEPGHDFRGKQFKRVEHLLVLDTTIVDEEDQVFHPGMAQPGNAFPNVWAPLFASRAELEPLRVCQLPERLAYESTRLEDLNPNDLTLGIEFCRNRRAEFNTVGFFPVSEKEM